jgi:hypothetical protein
MILDKRRSKRDESDHNCGIEKKTLAGNSYKTFGIPHTHFFV